MTMTDRDWTKRPARTRNFATDMRTLMDGTGARSTRIAVGLAGGARSRVGVAIVVVRAWGHRRAGLMLAVRQHGLLGAPPEQDDQFRRLPGLFHGRTVSLAFPLSNLILRLALPLCQPFSQGRFPGPGQAAEVLDRSVEFPTLEVGVGRAP